MKSLKAFIRIKQLSTSTTSLMRSLGAVNLQSALEAVVSLGSDQAVDEVGRCSEEGLKFPLTSGEADGRGKMGFAQAAGTEKDEMLVLFYKIDVESLKSRNSLLKE